LRERGIAFEAADYTTLIERSVRLSLTFEKSKLTSLRALRTSLLRQALTRTRGITYGTAHNPSPAAMI
jgi:hypothetical protein